jgi:hypothetical protein
MSQRRFSLFRSVPPVLIAAAAAAAAAAYLARAQRRIAFAGKTVVISGGSRGLGLELGRGFAAEERISCCWPAIRTAWRERRLNYANMARASLR